MHKIPYVLLFVLLLSGCGNHPQTDEAPLYVSIQPLREIVREITGDDFGIAVLVPAGASPETFEPTPRQFAGLNEARLIFSVGLIDFEQALLSKIEDREKIVNLSRGISPIAGSCAHEGHAHGVDPHVWTSPKALQQIAANAFEAIRRTWPDSVKYAVNYERLRQKLEQLDARTAEKLAASAPAYFIIYHPAFTYYARDYGLRQEAIESDGKEPSAKRLAELIRKARKDGVQRIFYQSQFPASTVEVIARDIDAEAVRVDPLREDVLQGIEEFTDLIVVP